MVTPIRALNPATRCTAAAPIFDAELIARHDVSGPRYTSYPAAPQFRDMDETVFRAAATASNEEPIPRPLSIYIHVPYCYNPCFYCGCTRIITRDRLKGEQYLNYLCREIALVAPMFDRDRPVQQLHLGGGTPNFLDEQQLSRLVDVLERQFSMAPQLRREFGIELDPRYAEPAMVQSLAALGFNRVSFGIQDFDPAVQAAVNREQSAEHIKRLIETARVERFRSISVDLIYGLPLQTVDSFRATLEKVIALTPDRIATYAYAHLPERFPAQRQIVAEDLPDAATRLQLLGLTIQMLTGAGYHYVGMDHFALPHDDLAQAQRAGSLQRNFQGYSTHAQADLIGLGMSAVGSVGNMFSQNARDIPTYFASLDAGRLPIRRGHVLSHDDVIRADVIQQLMCRDAIDVRQIENRHRLDFAKYFASSIDQLQAFVDDGLVSLSPRRIEVLPKGKLLLRNVAMCFDAYLAAAGESRERYSKTL